MTELNPMVDLLTKGAKIEKDLISSLFNYQKEIGADKVAVPTQCWKVIYIVKTKEWMAYLFNNTTDKPTGVNSHKVTVADITKLTGFKFQ